MEVRDVSVPCGAGVLLLGGERDELSWFCCEQGNGWVRSAAEDIPPAAVWRCRGPIVVEPPARGPRTPWQAFMLGVMTLTGDYDLGLRFLAWLDERWRERIALPGEACR